MTMPRHAKSNAKPWTDAERKRLLTLSADDRSWRNIARAFPGRSASACKQMCNVLLREAQGIFRVHAVTPQKANGRISRQGSRSEAPTLPADDTRSITGVVFGDPLPGRSALDRKRSEACV